MLAIVLSRLPSPGVRNTAILLDVKLKDIEGLPRARWIIISEIYPASVASFFKNLNLAGVL